MKSAVTIFLAFLLLTSSCKFIEEKGWFGKSKADTMAVWQARQDSLRVADSIKAEVDRMKAREQARIDSIRSAEQARSEWEQRFRYHIIVGSFLTPEYAEDYLQYYRSMGYDAHIIKDRDDRFNLVSAEVHENLNRAARRLYQYQDTVNFEAWLYVME